MVEKIWKQQNNEKPRQYEYFTKYLHTGNISIKKFHQKILKQYEKDTKKTTTPPTFNTLEKWSTNNQWIKRKEAYKKHILEQTITTLEEDSINERISDANKDREIKHQIQKIINETFNQYQPPLSSKDAYAMKTLLESYQIIKEEMRFDFGQPTEITQNEHNGNLSIDQDVEIKSKSVFEIIDEFDKQLETINK